MISVYSRMLGIIVVSALLCMSGSTLTGETGNPKMLFVWNDEIGKVAVKEILWEYRDAKIVLGYSEHIEGIKPELHFKVSSDSWSWGLEKARGSHYIVQFIGPVDERWYGVLREKGAGITPFVIPDYAVIVKCSEECANALTKLPFVHRVLPYSPWFKCTKDAIVEAGSVELGIFLYPDADETSLMKMLKETSEYVIFNAYLPYWKHIYTKTLASRIPILANLDEVFSIGRHYWPTILNDVAAGIIEVDDARDTLLSGLPVPLTGRGQIAGIADTGLDTGRNDNTMHADFQGKILWLGHYNAYPYLDPTSNDSDDIGHGTHVAGSVLGTGKLSADYGAANGLNINYSGIAPEAKLVFQKIASDSGYLLGTGSLQQFLEDAYTYGARVHHNSWGSSQNFGAYDDMAVTVDTVMWQHKDYLVSFSAGNSGPSLDTIGSPATAKNCLSVGASKNARPEFGGGSQGADDPTELAGFSSRGPTDDNRIKPDIVSPGTYILSTMSSVETWGIEWASEPYPIMHNYHTSKPAYCFMGGTSMSGPITAGAALLVRQYFTDIRGISPSAALVKATLINGAIDMGYGYPSNHQGWGRTNLRNSLFPEPPRIVEYVDETNGLTTGTQQTYTYNVVDSSVPLKITLVWTDYPGSQNANPAIVNNLDLEVVAPDGTTYYRGNQFENNWSKPNPATVDARNNVENVFIKNPAAGTWTVRVKGTNVPQGPQPYALVVSAGFPPSQQYQVRISTDEPLQKVVTPGGSAQLTLTVLNYGTNQDTIRLTATQHSGITTAFSENNIGLGSGQTRAVRLTFSVDSSVPDGVYEFKINATSMGNTSKQSSLDFKLIVVSIDVPSPVPVDNRTEPQSCPDIAVNGNDVWVVYVSKEGDYNNPSIYVKHSSDGGNTFPEKWKVSSTAGYCDEPSITVSSSGHVLVAWHADEKYIRANVYVPGQGWRGEKTLRSNTNTYYPISGYPSTLIDRNNRFWVFWRDNNLNSQTQVNFDIWASYSTDYGNTWSAAAALPNSLSQREYMPRACIGSDGNIHMVFYVLNANRDIYYRKCVVSGTTYTWEDAVQLEDASSAQLGNDVFPNIFAASDGKIWVSWHSDRESAGTYRLYLKYFDGSSWSNTLGGFGQATTSGVRPDISEKSGVLAVSYVENSNPYGNANIAVLVSSDCFQTSVTKMLTADAYSKAHPGMDTNGQEFFVVYQTDTPFTRNDIALVKFTVSTDLIPPTITHTPVKEAVVNTPVQIIAQITDNNVVAEAKLYYKASTQTDYTEVLMNTTGNTYSATIPATAVTLDGVDYYIAASDGANTAKTGIYHINVTLPALYVSILCNTTIESGEEIQVRVKVNSTVENAVENAVVMLSADEGTFAQSSGSTDSSGEFVTTYTAPSLAQEKTIKLYATANKTGYTDGTASKEIHVVLPQLDVVISPSSATVEAWESVDIVVRVTSKGTPVGNAALTLTATNNGSLNPATGSTNEYGEFSTTFTAPATTVNLTCMVYATAEAPGYRTGNGSATISVLGALPRIDLDVNFSKTSLLSGESMEIHINTSSTGTPLGNCLVNISATAGSVSPATGSTNTTGYLKITYIAPEVEENSSAVIYINVTKTNYKPSYGVISLRILPLPLITVRILGNTEISAGENLTIVIEATSSGSPVAEATVELTLSAEIGRLSVETGVTDEDGRFTVVYTAGDVTEEKNVTLSVLVTKEGYRNGESSITITIKPRTQGQEAGGLSLDPYILAGIVIGIGIIIAIVVLVLLLRKPKQQVPVYPQAPIPSQYPMPPQYPQQPSYPPQQYPPPKPPPRY
ncbi:MAG: S8 family serine peptidase [Thermoplasmata archaeon]